jgi:hypothetical protein
MRISRRSMMLTILFFTVTIVEVVCTYQYYWVIGMEAHGILIIYYPFFILICLTLLYQGHKKIGWGLFGGYFILMCYFQTFGFLELWRTQEDIDGLVISMNKYVESHGKPPVSVDDVGYNFLYPDTRKKIYVYEVKDGHYSIVYHAPNPDVAYDYTSNKGLRFIDD